MQELKTIGLLAILANVEFRAIMKSNEIRIVAANCIVACGWYIRNNITDFKTTLFQKNSKKLKLYVTKHRSIIKLT